MFHSYSMGGIGGVEVASLNKVKKQRRLKLAREIN